MAKSFQSPSKSILTCSSSYLFRNSCQKPWNLKRMISCRDGGPVLIQIVWGIAILPVYRQRRTAIPSIGAPAGIPLSPHHGSRTSLLNWVTRIAERPDLLIGLLVGPRTRRSARGYGIASLRKSVCERPFCRRVPNVLRCSEPFPVPARSVNHP